MIFDVINDSMVLEATKITQGDSGSSGMDADGWRQILVSRDYGNAGNANSIAYKESIHRKNR